MIDVIYCVFLVLVILAYRRFGGYRASIAALIAGWALLPVMDYAAPLAGSRGIALLQAQFVNRATVIGLSCLVGILLFERRSLREFRGRWFDLPVALWCLLPLASGLRNGLPLVSSIVHSGYLALVWGAPYLIGRLYLGRLKDGYGFAIALVVAGLVYVPLCLFEIVARPQIYGLVYGYHPHLLEGAARWLGWRPVALMEHGNQLGLWMVLAAFAAWWMHRARAYRRGRDGLTLAAAVVLIVVAVACQSLGPLILLFATMVAFTLLRRVKAWILFAVFVVPVVLWVGVRLTGAIRAEDVVTRLVGPRVVSALKRSPRLKSLAWRIIREEEHLPRIYERPILGHGRPGWWRDGYASPHGYWTHAVGMFGVVGLLVFLTILVAPVLLFTRRHPPNTWLDPAVAPHALMTAVVVMTLLDAMLNTTINLPMLAAAGGLSGVAASED